MSRYQRIRQLHAWILLGVFLPMLMLASVHVHTRYEVTESSCYACVHHLHHDGHLSSATTSVDHCVLCQFLAFHYLQAAGIAAVFFATAAIVSLTFVAGRLHGMRQRTSVPRAPPVGLWLMA